MKKLGFVLLVFLVVIFINKKVDASGLDRWTTQKTQLRDAVNGNVIFEVEPITKVTLVKSGKTWSIVNYNNQNLYVKTAYIHKVKPKNVYKGKKFKRKGRAKWNKCSWTWYSQRRLGGGGFKIPGRHVDKKRGFVLDKDGYICLASGRKNKKKKAIVPTPFGRYGKVYDTNGRNNNKWFDVYTNW